MNTLFATPDFIPHRENVARSHEIWCFGTSELTEMRSKGAYISIERILDSESTLPLCLMLSHAFWSSRNYDVRLWVNITLLG